MTAPVDVLAVYDRLIRELPMGAGHMRNITESRAAIAELIEARPKFVEGEAVSYTNPYGGMSKAVVRRAETRWDNDGKPYVFYTLRFPDGRDSRGIPQSALALARVGGGK